MIKRFARDTLAYTIIIFEVLYIVALLLFWLTVAIGFGWMVSELIKRLL